jgi:hypothetical protein
MGGQRRTMSCHTRKLMTTEIMRHSADKRHGAGPDNLKPLSDRAAGSCISGIKVILLLKNNIICRNFPV